MLTTRHLSELRAGDRVLSHAGRAYPVPLTVTAPLGPIEPGSPVEGVQVRNPNPDSPVQWVLYPAQMDGHEMEVDRP